MLETETAALRAQDAEEDTENTMLTEQTKIIVEIACRLLCGAQSSSLLDGTAAVNLSGHVFPCSPIELAAAQGLASEVRKLLGCAPEEILHDPEYILQAHQAAENLLADRLADTRLRILFVQDGEGGRAYWRCQEPARIITEIFPDVRVESIYPSSEAQLSLAYDAFVIQGGLFGDDAVPRMQHRISRLKEAGRVICYETDDDLDALHLANPARFQLTPRTIAFIKWLRKESDLIFTTTDYLKEKLGYPEKTIVAPNSFDFSRFIHPMDNSDRENFLFVLWHGGKGHELDLEWLRKPLLDFIVNKKARLEEKLGGTKIIIGFQGYLPEFISGPVDPQEQPKKGHEGIMSRGINWSPGYYQGNDPDLKDRAGSFVIKGRWDVRYLGALPIANGEFHQNLINLQPDICLCPLAPEISSFQAGKSLIKIQESILAGAACVVTETPPFNASSIDSIVLKCRTPESMIQEMSNLLLSKPKREALWQAGDTWLRQGFDLRVNASIWVDSIKAAIEKKNASN